jgi:hypothetical protein
MCVQNERIDTYQTLGRNSPTIHVRVTSELLSKIDELVGARYVGRAEAVRGLLIAGLKANDRQQAA